MQKLSCLTMASGRADVGGSNSTAVWKAAGRELTSASAFNEKRGQGAIGTTGACGGERNDESCLTDGSSLCTGGLSTAAGSMAVAIPQPTLGFPYSGEPLFSSSVGGQPFCSSSSSLTLVAKVSFSSARRKHSFSSSSTSLRLSVRPELTGTTRCAVLPTRADL